MLEYQSNNQMNLNLCLLDYTSPWELITFSQMTSFLCFNLAFFDILPLTIKIFFHFLPSPLNSANWQTSALMNKGSMPLPNINWDNSCWKVRAGWGFIWGIQGFMFGLVIFGFFTGENQPSRAFSSIISVRHRIPYDRNFPSNILDLFRSCEANITNTLEPFPLLDQTLGTDLFVSSWRTQ